MIDRINTFNYCIKLIGSTKEMVVHHNHLKLCYGTPQEISNPSGMSAANNPLYLDVMRRSVPAPVGGYTSSSNDPPPDLAPTSPHDSTPTA